MNEAHLDSFLHFLERLRVIDNGILRLQPILDFEDFASVKLPEHFLDYARDEPGLIVSVGMDYRVVELDHGARFERAADNSALARKYGPCWVLTNLEN